MKQMLLIVEDDLRYRNYLDFTLKHDFVIQAAESYDEAIEKLSQEIDIALLDVNLKREIDNNIDGLKLLEWIKSNKPNIICYVMSSYKQFNYQQEAIRLGAVKFLEKPIPREELIKTLKGGN